MGLQPPPSITPRQMTLIRIAASMAWADGHLAAEEVQVMLDRFSRLFATEFEQQQKLRQELQDYVIQNIPLSELIPKLESSAEKELVLQLGYDVILSSSRTPTEEKINEEEAAAYQRLVQLLNLPPEVVARVEANSEHSTSNQGMVDAVVDKLQKFIQG